MEALQISEIMSSGQHLQVTQKSKPLKDGDLALIRIMTEDKKVKDESLERVDEMFRYCFLMVGLKEKNFPNQLETMFLYQFLVENYGGHSIEEIKMAFRMAIKSELDLPSEDVTCYENFSAKYLAGVLNSYRRWSTQEYRRLEQHLPPPAELKQLEAAKEDMHWGKIIEEEYQHFLSFGREKMKLWPADIYNQLVKDDFIDIELWRKAMPVVRGKMVKDLAIKVATLEMRKFKDPEKNERIAFAESINRTNISSTEKQIEKYKNGENDGELELVAKQYCVYQFFKLKKEQTTQHIYQPVL